MLWKNLSEPWRACAGQAWEAYRAGSLPIGAVVTGREGLVVARGRNRIHEGSGPPGAVFGNKLAHAELNALLAPGNGGHDPADLVLWTTTEPCPLCVGAARMADVGGLRYAAREPWGGSASSFATVPYLKKGGVRVTGPEDPRLEGVLVALQVDRFLRLRPKILDPFLRLYEEVVPAATRAGLEAHRSGLLTVMDAEAAPASAVVDALDEKIGSIPLTGS